eukprot:6052661-Prymnesium_polylepis.1
MARAHGGSAPHPQPDPCQREETTARQGAKRPRDAIYFCAEKTVSNTMSGNTAGHCAAHCVRYRSYRRRQAPSHPPHTHKAQSKLQQNTQTRHESVSISAQAVFYNTAPFPLSFVL